MTRNRDDALASFEAALTSRERALLDRLDSPPRIQDFVDRLTYRTESEYCCPLRALRERRAHCFDGALLAATLLRRLGQPPHVVALFAEDDDEHMLALYRVEGHYGALAKSNFAGLRFREPIYRSLRELVMSYFEHYYNLNRQKTLRGYSVPVNLRSLDRSQWMTNDAQLDQVAERLDAVRRVPLLTARMLARLQPVDRRSYRAGMVGTDRAGVYRIR